MPEPSKFLAAFSLVKGYIFDGFEIKNVASTHEAIKRYSEYRYDITIQFEGNGTLYELLDDLKTEISKVYEIKGVRNIYRCTIDPVETRNIEVYGKKVKIFLVGHAIR